MDFPWFHRGLFLHTVIQWWCPVHVKHQKKTTKPCPRYEKGQTHEPWCWLVTTEYYDFSSSKVNLKLDIHRDSSSLHHRKFHGIWRPSACLNRLSLASVVGEHQQFSADVFFRLKSDMFITKIMKTKTLSHIALALNSYKWNYITPKTKLIDHYRPIYNVSSSTLLLLHKLPTRQSALHVADGAPHRRPRKGRWPHMLRGSNER